MTSPQPTPKPFDIVNFAKALASIKKSFQEKTFCTLTPQEVQALMQGLRSFLTVEQLKKAK